LHAYGTVDELNAVLGLALAAGLDQTLRVRVRRVQGELFVVGADLATPLEADSQGIVRTTSGLAKQLEDEIDGWQAGLPALKHFILPGGNMAGALLHQARTVCRRAERWLVALSESEAVNPEALRYLNRLSDWLFVAARVVTLGAGYEETTWQGSSHDGG